MQSCEAESIFIKYARTLQINLVEEFIFILDCAFAKGLYQGTPNRGNRSWERSPSNKQTDQQSLHTVLTNFH